MKRTGRNAVCSIFSVYSVARAATSAVAALGLFGCVVAAASPAWAQLPKKTAPDGMRQIADGATGRILASRMGGSASARKMMMALKMVAGEYFDKPIVVTRVFADRDDRNLQAAFTAKLKGVPVRGVASVVIGGDAEGGGAQGVLLFDTAKNFTKSFRTLVGRQESGGRAVSPGGGERRAAQPMRQVKLTRRTAPDGSSQISLPPGFRISGGYKGTLDISGPNGAVMVMGSPVLCARYEISAASAGAVPLVNFNDPVRAMSDYSAYLGRKAGVAVSVRVIDAQPVPNWPNGRAAYVRYRVSGAGKTGEGFGLFSIAPTDDNQALFYQSFIMAPSETYKTQFPGMLQAWATYSVESSVLQSRLMAAARSMKGMSDIISGVNADRQASGARVNEAWSDYIRDQETWQNNATGARYKISNAATNHGGIPVDNGVVLQPVPLGDL